MRLASVERVNVIITSLLTLEESATAHVEVLIVKSFLLLGMSVAFKSDTVLRKFFLGSWQVVRTSTVWADRSYVLLLGKEHLKVLILSLQSLVFTFDCSFLFLELADYLFQGLNFFSFLLARPHSWFPILQALSCLFVPLWVVFVVENPVFVFDCLL